MLYRECLIIHGTRATANNSTYNNAVFFFVSDLKIGYYTITTVNPWSQCIGQERKNIFRQYLFGDKILQNCLQIDATHLYDNDLLPRQETQKLKKNNIDLLCLV